MRKGRDCMFFFGFLVIFNCSKVSSEFVDQTNKEGSRGPQVVNHVTDIISNACLFDNRMFLRRIAFVASHDGFDPSTYRTGYHGGIWQVDESSFKQTLNNSKLLVDYNLIEVKLHISWNNVTWRDLRKPLYSALATVLFTHSKGIRLIPGTLEAQSVFWPVLKPGHSANEFFLGASNVNAKCGSRNELDLVVVLDFHQLSPFNMSHVQQFLRELFGRFRLSSGEAQVGIVTRRDSPIAAWYLNSTVTSSASLPLPALRYTTGSETVNTSRSLGYAKFVMFQPGQGARPGSSKVILLLTDGIDKTAPTEAKALFDGGTRIIAVYIGSTPDPAMLESIVMEPKCRNAKTVSLFSEMNTVLEEVEGAICDAPAILLHGDYTFPCSEELTVELPDTVFGVGVKVTVTEGEADLLSSIRVTRPDDAYYDVKMTSNTTTTPVLFVRGTNPIYVTVRVPGNPTTCKGQYTVHIVNGSIIAGAEGKCIVAGTLRDCDYNSMFLISHDIVLVPDTSLPYLCNLGTHENEYFPHPLSSNKFIMCDIREKTYLGLCPVNQTACAQITSGCNYTNPCSHESLIGGSLYHADPCGDPLKYIQCSPSGLADVRMCRSGQVWSLDSNACIYQYVHNPLTNTDDKNIINPCQHSHGNHVYFAYHSDPTKYILCDSYGNGLARSCPSGSIWNQETKWCSSFKPVMQVGR